jgi:2-polyprenyl-6-methoxyphenol hydroxylase-like FAD-dependent oxidoreductase
VAAYFVNGDKAVGNILIGADGVHSTTRRIINPGARDPRYSGLVYVGGFSRVAGMQASRPWEHFALGRFRFAYTANRSDEVDWFATFGYPDTYPSPLPVSDFELEAISSEMWLLAARDYFADKFPLAGRILSSTIGSIAAEPIYEIPVSEVWSRGPVVLIGDAAHCIPVPVDQGIAVSLEDGIVLAQCIRDTADTRTALTLYEELRRVRVERIVAHAHMHAGSSVAAWNRLIRSRFFPKRLRRIGEQREAWIHDYQIDWSQPLV